LIVPDPRDATAKELDSLSRKNDVALPQNRFDRLRPEVASGEAMPTGRGHGKQLWRDIENNRVEQRQSVELAGYKDSRWG
jgi:hypothetical protein